MADSKITGLPATTTLLGTDILPVVTDPGGTPTNKKITQANLAASIAALPLAGGTMAGDIAMAAHKVSGLAAGSVNGDALRYEQLVGLYLLLAGGTMAGDIAMGTHKITGMGNGSVAQDAAAFGQIYSGFQAQVQGSTTTQTLSTSSTLQAATGFSASISPTSSAHRIKITVSGSVIVTVAAAIMGVTVKRGTTDLSGGTDFVLIRPPTTNNVYIPFSFTWIDSPATTSSTTYQVFFHNQDNTSNCGIVGGNTNVIILEEIV